MSKFYLGTTFTRYREAREAIDQLRALGHECVEDWTRAEKDFDERGELIAASGDGYQQMDHWVDAAMAERDAIRTVAEARGFCVFLGEEASLGWPTEFGMSIAFGVPRIYLVAPFKTTVFVALPQVTEAATFEDVMAVCG